jgi:hypothetical protein
MNLPLPQRHNAVQPSAIDTDHPLEEVALAARHILCHSGMDSFVFRRALTHAIRSPRWSRFTRPKIFVARLFVWAVTQAVRGGKP